MPKSFAQWEAEPKAALVAPATAPPPEHFSSYGLLSLPSPPSMLGNAACSFRGPLGSLLGTTIGSSANELATSVPNLVKEVRRGGVMGPMDTEGVGKAMLDPLENIGSDVLKNQVLDRGLGWLGKGAAKVGAGLTKAGNSAAGTMSVWQRAMAGGAVDPLLNMLGIPHGTSEALTVAGPPIARKLGPVMTKVGNAMPESVLQGARSLAGLKQAANPELGPAPERPTVAIPEPGAARPSAPQAPPPDPFAGMSQKDLLAQKITPEMQAQIRADNIRNQPKLAPTKSMSKAAPSLPNAPSQNPGELWPYQ